MDQTRTKRALTSQAKKGNCYYCYLLVSKYVHGWPILSSASLVPLGRYRCRHLDTLLNLLLHHGPGGSESALGSLGYLLHLNFGSCRITDHGNRLRLTFCLDHGLALALALCVCHDLRSPLGRRNPADDVVVTIKVADVMWQILSRAKVRVYFLLLALLLANFLLGSRGHWRQAWIDRSHGRLGRGCMFVVFLHISLGRRGTERLHCWRPGFGVRGWPHVLRCSSWRHVLGGLWGWRHSGRKEVVIGRVGRESLKVGLLLISALDIIAHVFHI